MQAKHTYKKEGAEERERRHQFGQPEGNKPKAGKDAVNQREFYKWVESQATQAELTEYANDLTKPYIRRKFVQAFTNANTVDDFVAITNQTHGQPKQTIEVQDLPEINCEVFGLK